MSRTYLFFHPTRLPLDANALGVGTVQNLTDTPDLRSRLEQAFEHLQWQTSCTANAEVDGHWYELHVPESAEETLSLRCSLRANHDEFVQALCDRFGWLCFDERPMCFQPHGAPFAA